MLHLGKHPSEVLKVMAVSMVTGVQLHARFREEGLKALATAEKRQTQPSQTMKILSRVEETLG